MFKKLASTILIVLMVLSSSVTIFANNSSQFSLTDIERLASSNLSEEIKAKILNEVEKIDSVVQSSDNLESINLDNGDFVYTFKMDGFETSEKVSQVTFKEHENGNLEFDVVEGNLENNILVMDSGEIYIDGEEVIVNETSTDSLNLVESKILSPRDRTIYTTDVCPYGRESDYNDYVGTVKKSNLVLSNSLENLTNFALAAAIGLVDGWAGITVSAVAFLKGELEAYDPQTRYLSTIGDKYYHYDGERLPNGIFATKLDSSWYTKANYEGDEVFSIVYNCKEYY